MASTLGALSLATHLVSALNTTASANVGRNRGVAVFARCVRLPGLSALALLLELPTQNKKYI